MSKIRAIAQVVGFVTLGLLALYGVLTLLSGGGLASAATGGAPSVALSATGETVPQVTNYQGILRDTNGNLVSGYYTLTFRIYDDVVAPTGAEIWSETHISVTVRDGRFNALLGEQTPLTPAFFSSPDRFIGMTVAPSTEELVPRQRFASVPYAMHSGDVPSGAVMFFDLDVCPSGWQKLDPAAGRYLVGLPAGGTLSATVGTALTDQENRAVGTHDHNITEPGHDHSFDDPGHSHGINDPKHSHQLNLRNGDGWGYIDDSGWSEVRSQLNAPWDMTSEKTGITIKTAVSGITVITDTTGITVDNQGSVAGTNAPYLQLLVCEKQ